MRLQHGDAFPKANFIMNLGD